jgi:L-malate glycosyltransferase
MMNSSPHITIIIDSFYHANAGTENQLAKIVSGLSSKASIEVITLRDSPWLRENAERLGVKTAFMQIDGVRKPHTYRNFARLVSHLRRTKPQVVHTFFPVSNIVGVIAARLAGVKRIYSSRRDYGEWMTGHYLTATRWANRFATGIIANSKRVAELTCERESVASSYVRVIHNGIDLSPFAQLSRSASLAAQLGIPSNAKVLGLVANYRPMKRHHTLVKALPLVLQRHPDTHVIFVGTNMTPEDIESRIRALSIELGVTERVHQVHADGNVVDYLGLFDIGVNCSEGEGLSNAIMEYMAAGIAVVASSSGGNPDLITDRRNGLLFPLDDAQKLANAVCELLDDPALRASLVQTAREYVAGEFSMPGMLQKFAMEYGLESNTNLKVAAF